MKVVETLGYGTKCNLIVFFCDFDLEVLEEVTTTRWNRTKIMWEFVGKSKKEALSRKS